MMCMNWGMCANKTFALLAIKQISNYYVSSGKSTSQKHSWMRVKDWQGKKICSSGNNHSRWNEMKKKCRPKCNKCTYLHSVNQFSLNNGLLHLQNLYCCKSTSPVVGDDAPKTNQSTEALLSWVICMVYQQNCMHYGNSTAPFVRQYLSVPIRMYKGSNLPQQIWINAIPHKACIMHLCLSTLLIWQVNFTPVHTKILQWKHLLLAVLDIIFKQLNHWP